MSRRTIISMYCTLVYDDCFLYLQAFSYCSFLECYCLLAEYCEMTDKHRETMCFLIT